MLIRVSLALFTILFAAATGVAQLHPNAVDLSLVKISEKQKSVDLCPVYLVASDPELPTWEYKGVMYRGSQPDAADKFRADPDKYAAAARRQRWENNFVANMSKIWCPVTDQVSTGGGVIWNVNFGDDNEPTLVRSKEDLETSGIVFESCCKFCDKEFRKDDFPRALEKLKKRAAESYVLAKGKYTEGAASPVEGAILAPGLSALFGIWDIEVRVDGKLLKQTITFEDDDSRLAGKLEDDNGEQVMIDVDSFENMFFFVVSNVFRGETVEAEYDGARDGNEVSGVVFATVGGEDLELDFVGRKRIVRPPRDKKEGDDRRDR